MTLPNWNARSAEEAHLFNPAFCGALIFEFAKAYSSEKGSGVPLPLVFCALPITLHLRTRQRMPKRVVTSLYTWLERNPDVLVGYAQRVQNLTPYLREAIRFASARQTLQFDGNGSIVPGRQRAAFTKSLLQDSTVEFREVVAETRRLGRWFANAGETATILAAWGITV